MENQENIHTVDNIENKQYSNKREVGRFIVSGIVCALLDFLVSYGTLALFNKLGFQGFGANAVSTTLGFIIGVVANYLLSTYWVFKNVTNKEKTKTFKFIIAFVILSAIAWGLSVGTMSLCSLVCKSAWQINFDTGVDAIIKKLITFTFWDDITFWAYFISFCLRTIVGLVWNYFTRKYILYK